MTIEQEMRLGWYGHHEHHAKVWSNKHNVLLINFGEIHPGVWRLETRGGGRGDHYRKDNDIHLTYEQAVAIRDVLVAALAEPEEERRKDYQARY